MAANSSKAPTARWIVLAVVVLVSLYIWKQPYARTPALPSDPAIIIAQDDDPPKLYDSDSPGETFTVQTDANLRDGRDENPQAPSFPAFKTSADELPSQIYNPYPNYNSRTWKGRWKGAHVTCLGPRGVDVNGNGADMVRANRHDPKHLPPPPMFGSYDETALDSKFCFDRFGRYTTYGFEDELLKPAADAEKIDWAKVAWARLQEDCYARNMDRYQPVMVPNRTTLWMPAEEDTADVDSTLHFTGPPPEGGWFSSGAGYKKRSAAVIHMNAGTTWTIDSQEYIRSLIMELSLHSGAEYEVIIMVETNEARTSTFENEEEYRNALSQDAPEEFRDMSIIYNKSLLKAWYPKAVQSSFDNSNTRNGDFTQALQLLSLLRPDIEHFWQFEMDARFTGHHYQHLETIAAWSQKQPRRLLWERSSRYFIGSVHGNWSNFAKTIENATEDGGIWGPVRIEGIEPVGPDPPVPSPQQDDYEWGIGEDADFITAAPVADVTGSGSSDMIINYPGGGEVPSRITALSIMTRFSKRLLRAMHHGQMALGTSMPADRFPPSTALHHGLKLVKFPLPIFLDYAKSPTDIEYEFNFKDGKDIYDAASKFEQIGHRMSYYDTQDKRENYADDMYKRWLGYGKDPREKLCLPGMLLHSIQGV